MRWVPPALSSQRHRIQGFSLSYSPSEKTFPREEEPVDLTSRDHFLLPRRLNESKGIVAYHQSSVSSNSSSPYMKGCQTVEKLIQLATSQGDLSPTQLAAFWSWMPRLLNMMHNQDHCNVSKQEHQQLKNDLQIQSILAETIKKIDWFGLTALAGTALGMAKIVSHYRDRSNVGRSRQYQALLQELLFDCSMA